MSNNTLDDDNDDEIDSSDDKISNYRKKHNRKREITIDRSLEEFSLPRLTEKQHTFVSYMLEGMKAVDAYKKAYNSTMSKNAMYVEASRTLNNPKIQMWLAAAKKLSLTAGAVTFDRWLSDQQALIQTCMEEKAYSTAQEGHKILGKALGFIDKKDNSGENTINAEMLLQALSRVLPPLIGSEDWRRIEAKIAAALLGTAVRSVKMIEGTAIAVEVDNEDKSFNYNKGND